MTETVQRMCERVLKNYVDLKPEHVQEQKKFITDLLGFIVERVSLKAALFRHLFQDISFVGSFYEGLKITLPQEYDILFNLKLPGLNLGYLKISTENSKPGYITIGGFSTALGLMPNIARSWRESMGKWCDTDGNLLPTKVRSWFEGQIRGFVHKERKAISDKFKLEFLFVKRTGPATTLQIRRQNGLDIDIDLVPCIQFQHMLPPKPIRLAHLPGIPWGVVPRTKPRIWTKRGPNRLPRQYGLSTIVLERERRGETEPILSLFETECRMAENRLVQHRIQRQYQIPYRPRPIIPAPAPAVRVMTENGIIDWKLSFNLQEKILINGKQRLKPAIRMLKRLRDVRGWRLTSYHLKTVALWALEEHDWDSLNLYDTFLVLLKRLDSCLNQQCLKYFWDQRVNLFKESNINFKTRLNLKNSIGKIIRNIEKNPWEIEKILAGNQGHEG